MWPAIGKVQEKIFDELEKEENTKMVFVEGAVIVEAGFDKYYHELWCATWPKNMTVEMLLERHPNLTQEQAQERFCKSIRKCFGY